MNAQGIEKRLFHGAQGKFFQCLGDDCLLPCHSTNAEKSLRQRAQQIDEAKESLLRRGEWNGVKRFGR